MDAQKMYWAAMFEWKYELTCMEYAYQHNITLSRAIKILIAITSSAALATWAVWNEHQLVWGAIIVVGQVLNTIHEYTPYAERVAALSEMIDELSLLYSDIEGKWWEVTGGELTESEVVSLYIDFSKRWEIAQNGRFARDCVYCGKREQKEAKEDAKQYFKNLYGVGV